MPYSIPKTLALFLLASPYKQKTYRLSFLKVFFFFSACLSWLFSPENTFLCVHAGRRQAQPMCFANMAFYMATHLQQPYLPP